MEYFLGFLASLVSLVVFNKVLKKQLKEKILVPEFSQSRKLELVKDYLISSIKAKPAKKTQTTKHKKENSIKAYFWDGNVYWIENGFLLTAEILDNKIDETTKKRVDTHSLDKVELNKISFIVDKLAEGNKDDSSNSGK